MGRLGVALGFTLSLIVCLAAIPAAAEEVIEAWRGGGFQKHWSVSVNPTDGSCWVADGGNSQVVHLAADGTELLRVGGLGAPYRVSVNPTDGSCWVADTASDAVVHLAEDGAELWRGGGFDYPMSVSVNPTDGSCWVADNGNNQVVKLAADGTELARVGGFFHPYAVSVNPTDGSCWMADGHNHQVVHLAEDGTELWRSPEYPTFDYPYCVSVNPVDGSCWVAGNNNNQVVHLAEDGTELWRGGGFHDPITVSVNPTDGSCWVADRNNNQVVHLAEDGTELWRGGGFDDPVSVSVNPTDGSCWVADKDNNQVVHLVIYDGPPPVFDDVPPGFWAFDEIGACFNAGIVGGYGDGLYHPDWTLSRDQMAVFISRSIATPTGEMSLDGYVPPTTPSFSDVPTDFWCYKYIEYAVEHDIVGGYGDGTYQPQVNIDRGQMAVFIARAIAGDDQSVPDPTGSPSFPDVPADFWSYRHIEYIAAEEVAGGYYDGLYHPENFVSRDQMAVFITRGFRLM
jgi:DNA-binding beta-propeller fold protein YncE